MGEITVSKELTRKLVQKLNQKVRDLYVQYHSSGCYQACRAGSSLLGQPSWEAFFSISRSVERKRRLLCVVAVGVFVDNVQLLQAKLRGKKTWRKKRREDEWGGETWWAIDGNVPMS